MSFTCGLLNDPEIRRLLEGLARDPRRRKTEFTRECPTEWRPQTVRDPETDMPFSDSGAWYLIAERIRCGEPIEVISLRTPAGQPGYVMNFALCLQDPHLYVKLQLANSRLIGRSFHYSDQ